MIYYIIWMKIGLLLYTIFTVTIFEIFSDFDKSYQILLKDFTSR